MIRTVLRSCVLWTSMLLIAGCGSKGKHEKTDSTVIVGLAEVERREIALPINTSGMLSAGSEMKLSFKVGGIIESIFVDEGESVKEGHALARLDLSEIAARAAQAGSAHEKAVRDLARVERLYADTVVTLEQMQDAKTGLDVALSNLEVAEFNLAHATIRAPSGGTILRRFAEPSELVSAGMPVLLFGAVSEGWVVQAGVSDREVVQISRGDSAIIHFDAYPGMRFAGSVAEIAGSADPRSGAYEIELAVDPCGLRFISGFVAKIKIIPSKRNTFYIVPVEALVEADGDDGFVFAFDPGSKTVRRIPVKIGVFLSGKIGVTGDLAGIGAVVTEGAPYLSEGMIVRVAAGR